jgi:predicted Zn finger-like uncharacterized protein
MPIQTLCPNCRTSFSLPDAVLGKKVQCKKCNKPFVAVAVAASQPAGEADHLKKVLQELSSPTPAAPAAPVRATSVRAPANPVPEAPLRATPVGRPSPAVPVVEPLPREKPRRSPLLLVGLIGGGVAVLVGLLAIVILTVYFVFLRSSDSDPSSDSSSTASSGESGGSDRKALEVDPRIERANTLAHTPVDNGRRAEVTHSLEPMLKDPNPQVRLAGVRALAVWATRDNVPALIEVLKYEDANSRETRHLAIETLAKLRDERAVTALADRLTSIEDRVAAGKALQDIGPPAEKPVLRFAFHPDHGTRRDAREILKKLGTKDDTLLGQALEDLQSGDQGRSKEAAEWLTQINPQFSRRRAAVARALVPMLNEPDPFVRSAGLNALVIWATPETIPALAKIVEEDGGGPDTTKRHAIMKLLGKVKDPQAAAAVAGRLRNFFDRGVAAESLREMGPIAEQGVAPYLFDKDQQVRTEAEKLIKLYGTKDEVIAAAARRAIKDPEPAVVQAVVTWLGQASPEVLEGPETAKVLVPALSALVKKEEFGIPAKQSRIAAMQTLAKIKDEEGAKAVAYRLALYERTLDQEEAREAAVALVKMGPIAEPAVIECLSSNNKDVRITCCNVLAEIGSRKGSEKILKQASTRGRPEAQAAVAALKAIRAREAKSTKPGNDKKS